MDRSVNVTFSKLKVDRLCDWVMLGDLAPLMHMME